MRQITKDAVAAFNTGQKFNRDNTSVEVNGDDVLYKLHGHTIATRSMKHPGILVVSMCGWGTVNTRERLNGVLPPQLYVCQHKGEQIFVARGRWYAYDKRPVNPHAVYSINTDISTIVEIK